MRHRANEVVDPRGAPCPVDQPVLRLPPAEERGLRVVLRRAGDVSGDEHGPGLDEQFARGVPELAAEANALSVRLELQADCLAGIWAFNADRYRGLLEAGDIEEALNAASAIGDDRIQRETTGRVMPDSFTHGSSEQRAYWLATGFQSGELGACDTFAAASGG